MKKLVISGAILAAGLFAATPASAQSSAPTPPCRDPWVSQAVKEVQGRAAYGQGETGECNIQLYGGRWGSYAELKGYVQQALGSLKAAGLEYSTSNGLIMHDIKYFVNMPAAGMYIGTRGGAPAKPWVIDLAGGNVLAIERRCRPGYSAAGPGANSGCIR